MTGGDAAPSSGTPSTRNAGQPTQPPSRLFNVRLSEEHYAAVQNLAPERHLPMSTMGRAWLLDRLDEELPAS
jgi:hypothetical protein